MCVTAFVNLTHILLSGCRINYHHNFRIENGQRIYHNGIPDVIQVGEHQFIERRVVDLWINMMLVSWSVASVRSTDALSLTLLV